MVKSSGLPIMFTTAQTDWQQGRYSHPGPPWHSPPLGPFRASPTWWLLPFNSHWPANRWKSLRHTSRLPAQWSEQTCRLFRRGIAGIDGGRLQRKTLEWELAAEHKMRETTAWLCLRELSDLCTGHSND